MGNDQPTGPAPQVDPITFEVVRNGFEAVCNEMGRVVTKTAYSMPGNEGGGKTRHYNASPSRWR